MSAISPICSANIITQKYGCTNYDQEWYRADCPGGFFHAGIDLGWADGGNNHLGEPVRAMVGGVVAVIGPRYGKDSQPLGPYAPVILDSLGRYWEYGHVQAVYCTVGNRIAKGQRIADVGTLGASSGGHVHVEIRTNGPVQGPILGMGSGAIAWTGMVDPTKLIVEEDMLELIVIGDGYKRNPPVSDPLGPGGVQYHVFGNTKRHISTQGEANFLAGKGLVTEEWPQEIIDRWVLLGKATSNNYVQLATTDDLAHLQGPTGPAGPAGPPGTSAGPHVHAASTMISPGG